MKAKKQQDARVQPHSVAAEQSVLGCAIMDQDACFGIMSQLKKHKPPLKHSPKTEAIIL